MPVSAVAVQLAAALDLEAHQLDERRRAAALGRGRRRTGARSSCGMYCRPRSRSSSMSRRKFVSWNASPRARAGGAAAVEVARLEDRQHHLADHRGRAVHVHAQVVVGLVALDREVHRPSTAGTGGTPRGRCRTPAPCARPPSARGRRSARRRGRRRSGRRSRVRATPPARPPCAGPRSSTMSSA